MATPPATTKYKNHRFPVKIISHTVWLYFRFCLSFRDVEELLLERRHVNSAAATGPGHRLDKAAVEKVPPQKKGQSIRAMQPNAESEGRTGFGVGETVASLST